LKLARPASAGLAKHTAIWSRFWRDTVPNRLLIVSNHKSQPSIDSLWHFGKKVRQKSSCFGLPAFLKTSLLALGILKKNEFSMFLEVALRYIASKRRSADFKY